VPHFVPAKKQTIMLQLVVDSLVSVEADSPGITVGKKEIWVKRVSDTVEFTRTFKLLMKIGYHLLLSIYAYYYRLC
jgi:hypothetical protein